MKASEAGLDLMKEVLGDLSLAQIKIFAADVGPGSFTGVKVGVTLAKTLAWSQQAQCGAVSAFDLIAFDAPAAIPIRRGVVLRRDPGSAPELVSDEEGLSAKGYGLGRSQDHYPLAETMRLIDLKVVSPHDLLPDYQVEPSISQPKKPLIMGDAGA